MEPDPPTAIVVSVVEELHGLEAPRQRLGAQTCGAGVVTHQFGGVGQRIETVGRQSQGRDVAASELMTHA